jgi:hypothetical protein
VYKQAHRLEEAALAEKECRPALEEAPSPGK